MLLIHPCQIEHIGNIVRLKPLKSQENLLCYCKILIGSLEDTYLGHLLEQVGFYSLYKMPVIIGVLKIPVIGQNLEHGGNYHLPGKIAGIVICFSRKFLHRKRHSGINSKTVYIPFHIICKLDKNYTIVHTDNLLHIDYFSKCFYLSKTGADCDIPYLYSR